MTLTTSEQLTHRFYEWEQRGRGWKAFESSVDLEPVYFPFYHRTYTLQTYDDTKKKGIFNSLLSFGNEQKHLGDEPVDPYLYIPPVEAYEAKEIFRLIALSVNVPSDVKVEAVIMQQLLFSLSVTGCSLSFEIWYSSDTITLQFVCPDFEANYAKAQITAFFPSVEITQSSEVLEILSETKDTYIIDLALAEEFMRPLRMFDKVDPDPYIGIFAAFDSMSQNTQGVIQILFKQTENPWPESILRSVSTTSGEPFFADDPDMLKYAKNKVSSPVMAVTLRVIGQADTMSKAEHLASTIAAHIQKQTASEYNRLIPLSASGYTAEMYFTDILLRRSHRLGMLINCAELSTLVHFPSPNVSSAKLRKPILKTKSAPDIATGHSFILGTNKHQNENRSVSISNLQRLKHTHIIGATGTGKSTLLLNMVAQDMELGNGLAVLDPHGDLIDRILDRIPENRLDDVVLIDPADTEYPVGFNILSAYSEVEKNVLSSDLVAVFRRLSTSWGDQMNSVFANAILALLESSQGGTLIDLRRFLIEKQFRDDFLTTVNDEHIKYYWSHEFPLLKTGSIGPILTRLDTFLRPRLIRNMVSQKKSLDFEHILDSKKILLIKVSEGLIGTENSYLLGTFFVSKIYQAAMARQAKSQADRTNFFVYIDEFQNFITQSISHILSGARKYHIGLTLAHQDMQQLQKYDTELASSVTVNAGTRICFRLGDTDARRFAGSFSFFTAEDLESLGTGEAIARIQQYSYDFNLSITPSADVDKEKASYISNETIRRSRLKYGGHITVEPTDIPSTVVAISSINPPTTFETQSIQEDKRVKAPLPVQQPEPKVESEHRRLQLLIKKMAEARGFKASIEEPLSNNQGRVDISLERGERRIACELSVTTGDEWEAHNIEKCLVEGYNPVIVCSKNTKTLSALKKRIAQTVQPIQQEKILLFTPEELYAYLNDQIIEETKTETVMKGYKIQIEYDRLTADEMGQKQNEVAKAITESIRKKRKKDT